MKINDKNLHLNLKKEDIEKHENYYTPVSGRLTQPQMNQNDIPLNYRPFTEPSNNQKVFFQDQRPSNLYDFDQNTPNLPPEIRRSLEEISLNSSRHFLEERGFHFYEIDFPKGTSDIDIIIKEVYLDI